MFPFGIQMTKRPFRSDPLSVADALRSAGAIKHTSALTDAIRQVEMANALAAVSKQFEALRPQTNALSGALQSQANNLASVASQVETANALTAVSKQFEALRPQTNALAKALQSQTDSLASMASQVEMANALTAVSKQFDVLRPQTSALAKALQSQTNSLAGMAKQVEMANALAAVSEPFETLGPQVNALAATPAYVPTRPQAIPPTVTRGSRVATTEELGARIRQRRQALGMTQQDAADAAGTGRRFVSELEAGKPTLEIGKILDVCQALGLDLSLASR